MPRINPDEAPCGYIAVPEIVEGNCKGCAFSRNGDCTKTNKQRADNGFCHRAHRIDDHSVIFVREKTTSKKTNPRNPTMKTPTQIITLAVPRAQATRVLQNLEEAEPALRWSAGQKPSDFDPFRGCSTGESVHLDITPDLKMTYRMFHADPNPKFTVERLRAELAPFIRKKIGDVVTAAWLRRQGACNAGITKFIEVFGPTAKVSRVAVIATLKSLSGLPKRNWLDWLKAHPK